MMGIEFMYEVFEGRVECCAFTCTPFLPLTALNYVGLQHYPRHHWLTLKGVYMVFNPRDLSEVIYVGVTGRSLAQRLTSHIQRPTLLGRWIKDREERVWRKNFSDTLIAYVVVSRGVNCSDEVLETCMIRSYQPSLNQRGVN